MRVVPVSMAATPVAGKVTFFLLTVTPVVERRA